MVINYNVPSHENLGQSTNKQQQKMKQSGLTAQIISNIYNGAQNENKYSYTHLIPWRVME